MDYKKASNEELADLAKKGDELAKEVLIEKNIRFCNHIAKKFTNLPIPFDDLVSLASIGMVKAYQTFKIESGNKFVTYASRLMINEILMFQRRDKKHIGHMSMDTVVFSHPTEGTELTLGDMLEDERVDITEGIERKALLDCIKGFMKNASERDKQILIRCVANAENQLAVAQELDISQSYVSRLVTKVKEKLKKFAIKTGYAVPSEMSDAPKVFITEIEPQPKKEDEEMTYQNAIGQLAYIFDTYPELSVITASELVGVSRPTAFRYHKKYKENKLEGVGRDTSINEKVQEFLKIVPNNPPKVKEQKVAPVVETPKVVEEVVEAPKEPTPAIEVLVPAYYTKPIKTEAPAQLADPVLINRLSLEMVSCDKALADVISALISPLVKDGKTYKYSIKVEEVQQG